MHFIVFKSTNRLGGKYAITFRIRQYLYKILSQNLNVLGIGLYENSPKVTCSLQFMYITGYCTIDTIFSIETNHKKCKK